MMWRFDVGSVPVLLMYRCDTGGEQPIFLRFGVGLINGVCYGFHGLITEHQWLHDIALNGGGLSHTILAEETGSILN